MNDSERKNKLNQRAILQAQIDSYKDLIRQMKEDKDIWKNDLWDWQYQLANKIIENATKSIEIIDTELDQK